MYLFYLCKAAAVADRGGAEEGAELLHPQVLAQPGRRVIPQAGSLSDLLFYFFVSN